MKESNRHKAGKETQSEGAAAPASKQKYCLKKRNLSSVAASENPVGAKRFDFGKNWKRYLKWLNSDRIRLAEDSLKAMLQVENLRDKTFLDAGSGSGLFSLAARRLEAQVHSFDYDTQSVACTLQLKERYFPNDPQWVVRKGSVLDKECLARLGTFDVVYSWGVLHHTGAMWQALDNVASLVAQGGQLYIAIYNDQGRSSKAWRQVKRLYNALPGALRWVVLVPVFFRVWGPPMVLDLVHRHPFHTWRHYGRGMSPWVDVVDWAGGMPFEVAKPEEIFDFYKQRGFHLQRLKTCAGNLGCNEFVFQRLE